jgi:bifunctional DNA-binding transcriptional regulator/antitoxin component of YhaV-PrlF toxin-antitoxin module
MTKIVYNRRYGGFSLSEAAIRRYLEIKGGDEVDKYDISRDDPILTRVVEELGSTANGYAAALAIRELPAGTKYRIEEYDGIESVVTIDEHEWSVA